MKWIAIVLVATLLSVGMAAAYDGYALKHCMKFIAKCGDAWGELKYSWMEMKFYGHDLQPKTWYTLVDFESKDEVTCYGTKKSNSDGDVRICSDLDEAKVRDMNLKVVLTKDVDCDEGEMKAWHPKAYLYGDGPCEECDHHEH